MLLMIFVVYLFIGLALTCIIDLWAHRKHQRGMTLPMIFVCTFAWPYFAWKVIQ